MTMAQIIKHVIKYLLDHGIKAEIAVMTGGGRKHLAIMLPEIKSLEE